jgi:hypothetical protein
VVPDWIGVPADPDLDRRACGSGMNADSEDYSFKSNPCPISGLLFLSLLNLYLGKLLEGTLRKPVPVPVLIAEKKFGTFETHKKVGYFWKFC